MVYIHVKKVGAKKYYTLRVSYRDKQGRIITKDLENLGDDLRLIKLDTLEKKYKKEIRKSHKALQNFLQSNYYLEKAKKKKLKKSEFFSQEEVEEIEAVKIHFREKFPTLDPLTRQEVYGSFLIKFAVSSSAIEGNTINLAQASKLLTENILPKNKTLREVYDLQNTQKVFFSLLGRKTSLRHETIQEIHDQLLENIDARKGYRGHDIHILGQPFKPSPARYVKADMDLLLRWYEQNKDRIHPLALAIFFHHKFENIHPFSDGNGRTGRMILNWILLTHHYPAMIIPQTLRETYLRLMNEADQGLEKSLLSREMKHYQPLFRFMVTEFKKTYWNTFLV
ncbi:Fic family protein [Candidatus Woesearchaeota archaeon]|nr:Fic family protein [Candidatus Woesearchaeota archaeon]